MILRLSMPRHRLFFQPCAGRIRKMEGSGAHAASRLTRRGSVGGEGLRAKTDAREREKSPAQVEPDSREALHPAPPAPAAASQAVALGHPPVCLAGKGGLPRARTWPCRRCQSTGQVTTRWPEHSGDSLAFSSPSQENKLFAGPTRRLGTLSQGNSLSFVPLCSAHPVGDIQGHCDPGCWERPSSIARPPRPGRSVGTLVDR